MNIRQFMQNPAGKGTVIPGREAILDVFNRRYITLTKDKPIDVNIYVSNDIIYYHALVTTEADERFNTYDVVLKFTPRSQGDINDGSVKNYEMQIFSNCPSFTYTYAYVANLNGILVDELKDKFAYEVLNRPPVSRNPGLIMGFEKSVYFVCKYILEKNVLLTKNHIKTYGVKLTKNILKDIRKDSVIEEEIQRSKNTKKEGKKAAQNKRVSDIVSSRKSVSSTVKKNAVNYVQKKAPIQSKKVAAKKPIKSTIKPIGKR